MYALMIVVHIIACITLIMVILLQAGRGGGLSETFGMSPNKTIFGTSATTFLTKATEVCAVIFLLTCLGLAVLSSRHSHSLMERGMMPPVAATESGIPVDTIPAEAEVPPESE